MAFKKHNRQYDLVLWGATGKDFLEIYLQLRQPANGVTRIIGYTGLYTAEYIAGQLPTNLKWAIAGRSRAKLEKISTDLKALNAERQQPSIEVCGLTGEDLDVLAKKTFVLITTVGPFHLHGEVAFKACCENGTHYVDSTGEVPWVARMIKKYEETCRSTGSIMLPQNAIESAPPDLITWSLASANAAELQAQTKDVTVSIHRLNAAPSGGTLETVFSLFDHFQLKELRAAHVPFALSPIPNPHPPARKRSVWSKVSGLVNVPNLGLLTTSLAGLTDKAIVERTWGLLSATPSRSEQFYGPNFTYLEYMKARNSLQGIATHISLSFFGILLALVPPFRKLVRRFVRQPGQGPDKEQASKEDIEYRGVGNPDLEKNVGKQAFCRAHFKGPMYYLTGVLVSQAALTLLEDDTGLGGGIYTPACLGQPYIDRLHSAGFEFETSIVAV